MLAVMTMRREKRREMIGSWGCLSCGLTVPKNHTGPCVLCGGQIGRLVPSDMPLDISFAVVKPIRVTEPPPVPQPRGRWTPVLLVAAAILCIGAPLLGASHAGWNAAAIVMIYMWSSNIGFYALSLVKANGQGTSSDGVHA